MSDSLTAPAARTNPASLAAVILAAGAGNRLRPLTLLRPKPLCPVANVPLLDRAIERARVVCDRLAVNVHHGRDQLERHLAATPEVHVSVEADQALGTSGALGHLRGWLAGRDVVAMNADTWCDADLTAYVDGWDRERPRLVVAGDAAFGPLARVVATLLPWRCVAPLGAAPAELYETIWRPAAADGALDVVGYDGPFFDCGTPASYLAANLDAAARAGGSIVGPGARVAGEIDGSVVGAGCTVEGRVVSSVVWDGAEVEPVERLDRAIRAGPTMTVLVR
jgi:NDP-sugar pyrophosphorylase family protein